MFITILEDIDVLKLKNLEHAPRKLVVYSKVSQYYQVSKLDFSLSSYKKPHWSKQFLHLHVFELGCISWSMVIFSVTLANYVKQP